MNVTERERLLKLIGMLGSSFDGERATAAGMIQRMAETKGLTINELMAMAYQPAGSSKSASPPPPPPDPSQFTDIDEANDLIQMLRRVASKPEMAERVLTPWEMQFTADVSQRYDFDYDLSPKQLVYVERILRKTSRLFP